jgi:hypothetical protein
MGGGSSWAWAWVMWWGIGRPEVIAEPASAISGSSQRSALLRAPF